jgi:hypothetical protein
MAGILLGLLSLLCSLEARAQEQAEVSAHFTWRAPPGCVNDATLVASVEQLLKRKVFVDKTEADVLVEGAAEPHPAGGWSATLRMSAPDGRELGVRSIVSEAAECRAVEGPLAVVLALLVDLEKREIVLEVPAEEPAQPAPKVAPKRRAPPERPPPREPEPWHGATSFGAVATWGFLPDLAIGLAARGELELTAGWAGALELGVWPEKRSDESGPGGGFSAWLVTAMLCPTVFRPEPLRLYGCAGCSSGIVSATGVGLADAESPTRVYAGMNARIGASLALSGPFALAAELGLGTSFSRPRFFYFEPSGSEVQVHQSSVVVPLGGIFLRAEL